MILVPNIVPFDFVLLFRREVVLYIEARANLIRCLAVDFGSNGFALRYIVTGRIFCVIGSSIPRVVGSVVLLNLMANAMQLFGLSHSP